MFNHILMQSKEFIRSTNTLLCSFTFSQRLFNRLTPMSLVLKNLFFNRYGIENQNKLQHRQHYILPILIGEQSNSNPSFPMTELLLKNFVLLKRLFDNLLSSFLYQLVHKSFIITSPSFIMFTASS